SGGQPQEGAVRAGKRGGADIFESVGRRLPLFRRVESKIEAVAVIGETGPVDVVVRSPAASENGNAVRCRAAGKRKRGFGVDMAAEREEAHAVMLFQQGGRVAPARPRGFFVEKSRFAGGEQGGGAAVIERDAAKPVRAASGDPLAHIRG